MNRWCVSVSLTYTHRDWFIHLTDLLCVCLVEVSFTQIDLKETDGKTNIEGDNSNQALVEWNHRTDRVNRAGGGAGAGRGDSE